MNELCTILDTFGQKWNPGQYETILAMLQEYVQGKVNEAILCPECEDGFCLHRDAIAGHCDNCCEMGEDGTCRFSGKCGACNGTGVKS